MAIMQELLGEKLTQALVQASCKLANGKVSSELPNALMPLGQRTAMLEVSAKKDLELLTAELAEGCQILLASLCQVSRSQPDINCKKILDELRHLGEGIDIHAFEMVGRNEDSKVPRASNKVSQESLLALLSAANALLLEMRFGEAAKAFKLLCCIDPGESSLWIGQGHAAYHNKQYDQAIHAYYKAAILRGEDPWPLVWAANACESKGEVEAAIDLLRQAHTFANARTPFSPEMRLLSRDIHTKVTLLLHRK